MYFETLAGSNVYVYYHICLRACLWINLPKQSYVVYVAWLCVLLHQLYRGWPTTNSEVGTVGTDLTPQRRK